MAIDPKARQIEIKLDALAAEVPIYLFNRFLIKSDGGFDVVYFGCVLDGELLNSEIIAITKGDVKHCFSATKSYIEGMGDVSLEDPRTWNIPRSNKPVVTANWLSFSHTNEAGELLFSNITFNDLAAIHRGQKKASEVSSRRVMICRMELSLYKQFMGNFFDGL